MGKRDQEGEGQQGLGVAPATLEELWLTLPWSSATATARRHPGQEQGNWGVRASAWSVNGKGALVGLVPAPAALPCAGEADSSPGGQPSHNGCGYWPQVGRATAELSEWMRAEH